MPIEVEDDIVISFSNVTFSYDDRWTCLDNISFDIRRGEQVALIGANGSGKSTLALMINALRIPTQGVCHILGYDTKDKLNHLKIRKNVGMLFQDPEDMIVGTTVDREIAFGLENLCAETKEINDQVNNILEALDIRSLKNKVVWELSGGEKQKVALASVLIMDPEIIIFDEPTSMMDPISREKYYHYVEKLHKSGKTIINITHNDNVIQRCTRILELSDGKLVRDRNIYSRIISRSDMRDEIANIIHKIETNEEVLEDIKCRPNRPIKTRSTGTVCNTIMKCENISYIYGGHNRNIKALDNISLSVGSGEVLGIIGTTGSGKSTLASCMALLTPPDEGNIFLFDHVLSDDDLYQVRKDIGYIMQYPEAQFFADNVFEEIAYFARNYGMKGEELNEAVYRTCDQVGLNRSLLGCSPFELSGGEQRRVAIASGLVTSPKFVIFDEPHAGLDKDGMKHLNSLIRDMRKMGTAIAIVTHELDFAFQTCDTILYMDKGKTRYMGDVDGAVEYMMNDQGRKWPMPKYIDLYRILQDHDFSISYAEDPVMIVGLFRHYMDDVS